MAEITINEKVMHGKPVLKGIRITVDEVLGMLESGMTYEKIEKEYKLNRTQILSVVKYATSFVLGEEVHKIPA